MKKNILIPFLAFALFVVGCGKEAVDPIATEGASKKGVAWSEFANY